MLQVKRATFTIGRREKKKRPEHINKRGGRPHPMIESQNLRWLVEGEGPTRKIHLPRFGRE